MTTKTKRDLNADLAICNAATSGPWKAVGWTIPTDDQYRVTQAEAGGKEVITAWQGVKYPGMPEISGDEARANTIFAAEARTGWPHAIERAIIAEAEVESLRMQRDSLEATLQHYRGYA
jgi:hypothetical protein